MWTMVRTAEGRDDRGRTRLLVVVRAEGAGGRQGGQEGREGGREVSCCCDNGALVLLVLLRLLLLPFQLHLDVRVGCRLRVPASVSVLVVAGHVHEVVLVALAVDGGVLLDPLAAAVAPQLLLSLRLRCIRTVGTVTAPHSLLASSCGAS
jgi:hypothetical protein